MGADIKTHAKWKYAFDIFVGTISLIAVALKIGISLDYSGEDTVVTWVCVSIVALIMWFVMRYLVYMKNLKYYGFGEIVERVQRMEERMECAASMEKAPAPASQWKCPGCGRVSKAEMLYCGECGTGRPF